ncbi:hypothetical protein AB6A40_004250 [Gnathostoma spinigerum]|uniref:Uncharacterized protein n=1 Tax=Gnathostoma spinigerum TaxID=75299 RepID=A0ABD6ED04_9BILA
MCSFIIQSAFLFACWYAVSNAEHSLRINNDPMKEYITRGMFSCSRDHVASLTKLHILMRESYQNYVECEKEMKDKAKSYPSTPFESINNLMREYQQVDQGESVRETASSECN